MKDLSQIPGDQLEKEIGFDLRHKVGAQSHDYLVQFLAVARQYGYATQDETWGELEKEMMIAFRNLERWRRAMQFLSDSLNLGEDGFAILERFGEEHWDDERRRKQRMEDFMARIRREAA